MSNNVKPLNKTYTPEAIAAATAQSEERKRELHEAGKREGLKHAQRYRDGAMVGIGFTIGLALGALGAASLIEQAAFNAGAVADRVLARTVEPVVLPPAPDAHDPSIAYQNNANDARAQACRDGVRRACGGTPPRDAE